MARTREGGARPPDRVRRSRPGCRRRARPPGGHPQRATKGVAAGARTVRHGACLDEAFDWEHGAINFAPSGLSLRVDSEVMSVEIVRMTGIQEHNAAGD